MKEFIIFYLIRRYLLTSYLATLQYVIFLFLLISKIYLSKTLLYQTIALPAPEKVTEQIKKILWIFFLQKMLSSVLHSLQAYCSCYIERYTKQISEIDISKFYTSLNNNEFKKN